MAQLFDEVTRIVGSQMPRRRALRLICRGLAGGALVALGLRTETSAAAGLPPQALGNCFTFANCTGLLGGLVTYEDCCGPADEPCINKSWRQQGTSTCTRCSQCNTGGGPPSPRRPGSLNNG